MNDDITQYMRDIKIELLKNSSNISIDIKRKSNFLTFLRPGHSSIKELIKNGGILTGSRALKCYTINNKSIIERETNDWDFIVDERLAMKICEKNGIYELPNKESIVIDKRLMMFHGAYSGETKILPRKIDLIIKSDSELPPYDTINGVKIASLHYIINEKYKLYKAEQSKQPYERVHKHEKDLKEIIIKLYNNL
jgi:hypothetical protein